MDYAKLTKRIEHMIEYESDDSFLNIDLKEDIAKKLFDYQHLHLFNLIVASKSNNVILDGSDTGTGKTYTSIAFCKQLNIRPLIICPKVIMTTWKKVCDQFEVKPLDIVNYETIKLGKTYDHNGVRNLSKYIEIHTRTYEKIVKGEKKEITEDFYKWRVPKYGIIIFDEVHKAKNPRTQNGKLLMSSKEGNNVLMLSATVSDSPRFFHIFGYMLGFYKNLRQGNNWVNGMIKEDRSYIGLAPKQSAISSKIYPMKGSRMSIKELGDRFPKNQVSAECYFIGDDEKETINKPYELLKEKDDNKSADFLNVITVARQIAELSRVDLFYDLTMEYIENGYNVVIFLNFLKSVEKLSTKLKTKCLVTGEQTQDTQNANIESFQNNKENIIICTFQAGGTGVSMHDLHGRPRVSLLSPPTSSIYLQQSLGRINRVGSLSPSLQRIIFCSGTHEESICNKLKDKLAFISKINDDDLLKI